MFREKLARIMIKKNDTKIFEIVRTEKHLAYENKMALTKIRSQKKIRSSILIAFEIIFFLTSLFSLLLQVSFRFLDEFDDNDLESSDLPEKNL